MQLLSDYLELVVKILTIPLAIFAGLQLLEAKKKRHIDMYLKIYEMYTSEIQKQARKDTVELRDLLKTMAKSGIKEQDLTNFYSTQYHKTTDKVRKGIDKSVINRVRFLNMTGRLLKMNLINKDMLFDLIGLGYEHDYETLNLVLETHRRDHNAPQMYPTFELVNSCYTSWKKDKVYYFKIYESPPTGADMRPGK